MWNGGRQRGLPPVQSQSVGGLLPALTTAAATAISAAASTTAVAATTTEAAATAAAATTTEAAASATSTRPALSRTSLVDSQYTTLILLTIGLVDRLLYILLRQVDETETTALNDAGLTHGSPRLEEAFQLFLRGAVGQVTYVQRLRCQRFSFFPGTSPHSDSARLPATGPIQRGRHWIRKKNAPARITRGSLPYCRAHYTAPAHVHNPGERKSLRGMFEQTSMVDTLEVAGAVLTMFVLPGDGARVA